MAPAHRSNGPVAPAHKSNGPVAPAHKSNGPVAPAHKSNGPVALAHKSNGAVAPAHKSNGPVAPVHKSNGPVAPAHKSNGPVAPAHKSQWFINLYTTTTFHSNKDLIETVSTTRIMYLHTHDYTGINGNNNKSGLDSRFLTRKGPVSTTKYTIKGKFKIGLSMR